jgi:glycosyltransferase involved in cell wall biosynthesis
MPAETVGRVDFHLHSYASNVTMLYAANAFSLPESYSDPCRLYAVLKQRGMSLVTLTDHNTIDGVRELLDKGYRDVFISSELTTTFPEDGCNIHVTAANVTEAQFAEADRLRPNVYELIAYLDAQIALEAERPGTNKLAYFMTHPLISTGNRPYGREGALAVKHLEKALLLCNMFEVHNGMHTRAMNELTARMFGALDPERMERLAAKHDLEPKGTAAWVKTVVGGSDDHSGINPGRTWTEAKVTGPFTPNALVEAMRRRQTRAYGAHGGPTTLAHAALKLLYEGNRRKAQSGPKAVGLSGPLKALLRLVFDRGSERLRDRAELKLKGLYHRVAAQWERAPKAGTEPFEKVLEAEVHAVLADAAFRAQLDAMTSTDARIFHVLGTLVNRIFARYLRNLRAAGAANLVGTIKEIVALLASNVFVSLPYLLSFLQQSSDSLIAKDVRKAFELEQPKKLALFTDTLFEINGVSASIKRMMREALKRGIDFTVVTCVAADERALLDDAELQRFIGAGKLKVFTSVANLDFPEYDDLQIRFPPLLEVLQWLQEEGFTKVQISTPGVIGLAGLAAAKLLQLETAATYHTSVPEYVENYTRDVTLEALAWKYMILFYHSVDEVLVPSKFIARLLHKRGLRNRKLLILDRWVDVERFRPEKRVEGFWRRFGIEHEQRLTKFIYVGRLGVEKDLDLAAHAFRRLHETHPDVHFFLVGDGPYRKTLERMLEGLPVTFLGFLDGDDLVRAIASADVKLFPSTTDTWGNAPLEAQACGLPVVVSDVGGPAELMQDGVTGFKVRGRDADDLYRAMVALMDPVARAKMGRAARRFIEANRVDRPFTAILDSEAYRKQLEDAKQAEDAPPVPLTTQVLDLDSAFEHEQVRA